MCIHTHIHTHKKYLDPLGHVDVLNGNGKLPHSDVIDRALKSLKEVRLRDLSPPRQTLTTPSTYLFTAL